MSDPSGRAYPLTGCPKKREHCPSSQGAQRLRTSCATPGNPSEDAASQLPHGLPVADVHESTPRLKLNALPKRTGSQCNKPPTSNPPQPDF